MHQVEKAHLEDQPRHSSVREAVDDPREAVKELAENARLDGAGLLAKRVELGLRGI